MQYIVTTHKLQIETEELTKVELHAYITSSNEYYSEARGSQHLILKNSKRHMKNLKFLPLAYNNLCLL